MIDIPEQMPDFFCFCENCQAVTIPDEASIDDDGCPECGSQDLTFYTPDDIKHLI